ncbi:DDE-type integrase/transposase/recombinase [Pseudalkalibacillus sp. A8]|uniref:DDE-type integrase/transposase/recombinase n=1 Tax=Pseudalkalibacillus sp. A8 TaxID=3382641 RepID=UPI0038B6917A
MIAIHRKYPFYGKPRLKVALRKKGFQVNHKKVYRLMKELEIKSTIRKKRTYFGQQPSVVYPNRLKREFKVDKPNKVYVTDITYIRVGDRFYHFSAIQDLFNNEIVAWELSHRNDLPLVINTVASLKKERDVRGAMIHSDQGFQYTSKHYSNHIENMSMGRQPLSQRKLHRQCLY